MNSPIGLRTRSVSARANEIENIDLVTPHPLNRPRLEDEFDRKLRAGIASVTGGVSSWAALQAWEDWAFHMSASPVRAFSVALDGWAAGARTCAFAFNPLRSRAAHAPFQAAADDRRFRDPGWLTPPYDALAQAQLATEAIWDKATAAFPGVRAPHMRRVWFMGRQFLRAIAPRSSVLPASRMRISGFMSSVHAMNASIRTNVSGGAASPRLMVAGMDRMAWRAQRARHCSAADDGRAGQGICAALLGARAYVRQP